MRGGCGEFESVGRAQPRQAIGPLLKFIAHAETPMRRVLRGLAQGRQMQSARIVAADHHGEGVFKSQRRRNDDVVSRGIESADVSRDGLRIAVNRLFENGCKRRAGVLHVGVDAACNQRLLADITARRDRNGAPL